MEPSTNIHKGKGEPFAPHKRLWTPLKCKIFQNIMKNGTFAPEEQMFHFP